MSELKAIVNKKLELIVDDQQIAALDSIEISPSNYHVLADNQPYTAQIERSDFQTKTYEVSVNNELFTVQIQDELDQLIDAMGFEVGLDKKVDALNAPMPGLILQLNVAVGDEVKEDDALLILEAMKMENVLVSPRAGVIAFIHVSKGDAVDKNQLLIQFE